jgi:hypothetical protein
VADKFAPRIIVGNVPAGDDNAAQVPPFQYIPDPGDGSGIAAALVAAAAGYDVRIRPGTYDFGAGTVATPLTIPAGVRVSGAGPTTILIAPVGTGAVSQDVFSLGADAELADLWIKVPPGAVGGLAGSSIVQIPNAGAHVTNVKIDLTYTSALGQRNTTFGIGTGVAAAPSDRVRVEDCEIILPRIASGGGPYIGLVFGALGVDSTGADSAGPVVRGCYVEGGQAGILCASISGGTVEDCEFVEILSSGDGVFWVLELTALTAVRGPKITGCRVIFSAVDDSAGSGAAGIEITNISTDAVTSRKIVGSLIANIIVEYRNPGNLVGDRQAIKIRVDQDGTGQNNQGTITGITIINAGIGVLIQTLTINNAATDVGAILDWTVSSVVARGVVKYGAHFPSGCHVEVSASTQTKIRRVTITGSDFSGAPATGSGVSITAQVDSTIVVGNQLAPNGGTAIADAGTGSQVGQNILV